MSEGSATGLGIHSSGLLMRGILATSWLVLACALAIARMRQVRRVEPPIEIH